MSFGLDCRVTPMSGGGTIMADNRGGDIINVFISHNHEDEEAASQG